MSKTLLWPSRRMKDYRQHLPMNCGGVATVFSLYGPNQVVPESMLQVLAQERVSAAQIERLINQGGKAEIRAKAYYAGSKIDVASSEKRDIAYLEECSESVLPEALKSLLEYQKARCLILSCHTRLGPHWQTCYLSSGELKWYNAFPVWRPVLSIKWLGTPVGLVVVFGPAMQ